jgi:hypothetical protein
LGTVVPGGSNVVWGVLAVMLLALGVLLSTRGARRALHTSDGSTRSSAPAPMSAAQLLREATAAERDGRAADAVRFYFRRGLLLLLVSGRVSVGQAMLSAEVSRALHSEQFDALARTFDEIVYGGRPATAEDADASRRGWRALLGTVRR